MQATSPLQGRQHEHRWPLAGLLWELAETPRDVLLLNAPFSNAVSSEPRAQILGSLHRQRADHDARRESIESVGRWNELDGG